MSEEEDGLPRRERAESVGKPVELEFSAVEAAVMETARGRWFLAEYSRRNRVVDTGIVIDGMRRLGEAVAEARAPSAAGPPGAGSVAAILVELRKILGAERPGEPPNERLARIEAHLAAIEGRLTAATPAPEGPATEPSKPEGATIPVATAPPPLATRSPSSTRADRESSPPQERSLRRILRERLGEGFDRISTGEAPGPASATPPSPRPMPAHATPAPVGEAPFGLTGSQTTPMPPGLAALAKPALVAPTPSAVAATVALSPEAPLAKANHPPALQDPPARPATRWQAPASNDPVAEMSLGWRMALFS